MSERRELLTGDTFGNFIELLDYDLGSERMEEEREKGNLKWYTIVDGVYIPDENGYAVPYKEDVE